jgi:D-aspartate ligase
MGMPLAFVFNHIGDPLGKGLQINLSTLAVVRSLGRRGIKTILITTNKRDGIIHSRYVAGVEFCPYIHEPVERMHDFFSALALSYPGKKVLIPSVDECAWYVGTHYSRLAENYLIPAPDSTTIKKINNKRFQYETAQGLGIPIPETYFPQDLAEVEVLSRTISNYPYVIKPNVSFEWKLQSAKSGARGKKGIRVDSAQELLTVAKDIFLPGTEFMIQEIIGGRDQRLVTFLGFFSADHRPVSWFIRKKIRQCPIDFGYCTMTESCHDPVVLDQSQRLLTAINYYGVAGVEWKLDPATETYKLIEINGRPVNTTGCAIAAGVDLPAMAYFDAIGQPLPPVTDWKDGERWAWLTMDFWAARELAGLGHGSLWTWIKEALSIKADAVFAWDDFIFSFTYYAKFIGSLIKVSFKKFTN